MPFQPKPNTHRLISGRFSPLARFQSGLSLIELMIAMVIGIFMSGAMIASYVASKDSFRRNEQLAGLQQNARIAFESLNFDTRSSGMLGCFTGRTTQGINTIAGVGTVAAPGDIRSRFLVSDGAANVTTFGIEGYDFDQASPYTLSNYPTLSTTAANWRTNVAVGGVNTIPIATINALGAAPGSDVLVLRGPSGGPVRLSAVSTLTNLPLRTEAQSNVNCPSGVAKQSGLCVGSYAVAASCASARVFQVSQVVSTAVTGPPPYNTTDIEHAGTGNDGSLTSWAETYDSNAEVFPLQTVFYFVARSSNYVSTASNANSLNNGMSLYRTIVSGDPATLTQVQELIENVESMQITYGRDTTAIPDGVVDDYVSAHQVTNWGQVVSIRMGLLLRSADREVNTAVGTSATVNGQQFTFASTASDRQYDRRAFTTTVALRNKIQFVAP